jgi:hypothetical protein
LAHRYTFFLNHPDERTKANVQYSTWRGNSGEGVLYAAIKALETIEPGGQP